MRGASHQPRRLLQLVCAGGAAPRRPGGAGHRAQRQCDHRARMPAVPPRRVYAPDAARRIVARARGRRRGCGRRNAARGGKQRRTLGSLDGHTSGDGDDDGGGGGAAKPARRVRRCRRPCRRDASSCRRGLAFFRSRSCSARSPRPSRRRGCRRAWLADRPAQRGARRLLPSAAVRVEVWAGAAWTVRMMYVCSSTLRASTRHPGASIFLRGQNDRGKVVLFFVLCVWGVDEIAANIFLALAMVLAALTLVSAMVLPAPLAPAKTAPPVIVTGGTTGSVLYGKLQRGAQLPTSNLSPMPIAAVDDRGKLSSVLWSSFAMSSVPSGSCSIASSFQPCAPRRALIFVDGPPAMQAASLAAASVASSTGRRRRRLRRQRPSWMWQPSRRRRGSVRASLPPVGRRRSRRPRRRRRRAHCQRRRAVRDDPRTGERLPTQDDARVGPGAAAGPRGDPDGAARAGGRLGRRGGHSPPLAPPRVADGHVHDRP